MAGTIFALATAPGRAAVAVIRLSGPLTGSADAGALTAGFELVGFAAGLPPPQAARIRHPVAASTAHA